MASSLSSRAAALPLAAALAAGLALAPHAAEAQAPIGYLGKRQTAELGVDYNWLLDVFADEPRGAGPFTTRPGLALQYEYLVKHGRSVGLFVSHTGLGTFAADGGESFKLSETLVLAEWITQTGGGVIGPGWAFGIGYGGYRTVERSAREFSGPRTEVTRANLASVAASIGWRYRYVFADRLTVTPWARVTLPFAAIDWDLLSEVNTTTVSGPGIVNETLPIVERPGGAATFLRAGVSVGIVH